MEVYRQQGVLFTKDLKAIDDLIKNGNSGLPFSKHFNNKFWIRFNFSADGDKL